MCRDVSFGVSTMEGNNVFKLNHPSVGRDDTTRITNIVPMEHSIDKLKQPLDQILRDAGAISLD